VFDGMASRVPSITPVAMSAPLLKQEARLEWVADQLKAHELHEAVGRESIVAAFRAQSELEVKRARLVKKRRSEERAARRSQADVEDLAALLSGSGNPRAAANGGAWEQFLAVGDVLRHYGALDEWAPTEFGDLVSGMAGDNELWLAIVMLEVADDDALSAAQLAAVLASTLDERMRPNSYVAYSASDEVLDCLERLEDRAYILEEVQQRNGLSFAVSLESGTCGLVEAWAKGEEWSQVMSSTSLDPGDIFRILRRTVELLRQVSLVPYVSTTVQQRARAALRACDRYPLSDNVLMGAGDATPSPESEVQA